MKKLAKKSRTTVEDTNDAVNSLPVHDRKPLSEKATKSLIEQLHQLNDGSIDNAKKLRAIIYDLKDLSGYQSYGYGTWSDFCVAKLSAIGKTGHINRIVRSAEVEKCLPSVPIGTLPESVTRSLHKYVGSDDLLPIWKLAMDLADDGQYPTAEQVNEAIKSHQLFDQLTAYIKGDASKGKRLKIIAALASVLSKSNLERARNIIDGRLKQIGKGKSVKSRANKDTYSTNSDVEVDV